MSVVYNLSRMQLAVSSLVYPDMILLSMYCVINFIGCQSCRELNSRSGVWIQAINGLAPPYLKDFFVPVSSISVLSRNQSAARGAFIIPSATKNITYRRRSFAAAGPTLWNSLPLEIRRSSSLPMFRSRLKTCWFFMSWNFGPSLLSK